MPLLEGSDQTWRTASHPKFGELGVGSVVGFISVPLQLFSVNFEEPEEVLHMSLC